MATAKTDQELACVDASQQEPNSFTIGTQKAFKNGYAYAYERKHIGSETVYICTKGSAWARANEILVLRRVHELPGDKGACVWTAFDGAISADGSTLQCRQAVFRCLETDITCKGWHNWQTNQAANSGQIWREVDWAGELWAETRYP